MIHRSAWLAVLATALIGTTTASAGHDPHSVLKLKVMDDQGELSVRLDSEELGFNPAGLAEGESRTGVTGDGQSVTMTRQGDSMNLVVDGREFDIPWGMHGGSHDGQGHKMVVKRMHAGSDDGILIVTPEALDDATRETIRSTLRAAGLDQEIHFVGGDEAIDIEGVDLDSLHSELGTDGSKQIRVIRTKD